MTIAINCPSCKSKMRAPDKLAGRNAKCPKCGQSIAVPSHTQPGPAAMLIQAESIPQPALNQIQSSRVRTAPPPATVPPQPAAAVDVQLVRADSKACPFCGEQVLAVAKKCKHCGETIDVALRAAEEAKRASEKQSANPMVFMNAGGGGGDTIIVAPRKSVAVAILLTVLFGPLGMFYSTVAGGLIMLLLSVFLAVLTLGLSVIITWPICIIWAAVAASKHNAVRVLR